MRVSAEDPRDGRNLDPLLRELLAFGVVEPDPTEGGWRLVGQAQRRLDLLAAPPPPAEKVIHFGHRCVSCGEVRPTRSRPQGFVCDPCGAASMTPPEPAAPSAATPRMTA